MSFVPDPSGSVYVVDDLGAEHEHNVMQGINRVPVEGTNNPVESINKGTINRRVAPGPGQANWSFLPTPGDIAEELLKEAHKAESVISVVAYRGRANEEAKGSAGVTVALAAGNGSYRSVVTGVKTKFKTGPFLVGMGLVVGGKLYNIAKIDTETKMEVTQYGTVAANVATKDSPRVQPEAVNATESWRLVETRSREVFRGRVTLAGGFSVSAGSSTGSATMDLLDEPTETLEVPAAAA